MTEPAYGDSFQELLALEEYKSLRAESADAKRNQQTIFQWSMAAAGIIVAGSIAVTRTTSVDSHANSNGYLSAALSFLMVLPTVLGCAFGAWLGEVQRMERVGRYLRNREDILLRAANLRLATPSADTTFIIHWENVLVDAVTKRFYRKNILGSAAACGLFTSFFFGSLITALALISTSPAKYAITPGWRTILLTLALFEALAFLVFPLRVAVQLLLSTKTSPPSAAPTAPSTVRCDVILPCLNEQDAVEWVASRIPPAHQTYLVDDHSTDRSRSVAAASGLTVIQNLGAPGVGGTSNLGISQGLSPVICIFDCDGTFDPAWINALVEPLEAGDLDLVIGERDPASDGWTLPHRIASSARIRLLKWRFPNWRLTDMGSARAIRREVLINHSIQVAPTEAWSVDLALKVMRATSADRVGQVRVPYLPRIGRSKITGTLRGSLRTVLATRRVIRANRRAANSIHGRP
jgi:hypothetical protein